MTTFLMIVHVYLTEVSKFYYKIKASLSVCWILLEEIYDASDGICLKSLEFNCYLFWHGVSVRMKA